MLRQEKTLIMVIINGSNTVKVMCLLEERLSHIVCVLLWWQPASLWKSNFSKLFGKRVKVVLGFGELSAAVVDKNVCVLAARKHRYTLSKVYP